MNQPPFTCAICQRATAPKIWTTARDRDVAPICYRCEVEYTTVSSFPRDRRIGKPKGGSHMDRRHAMRLCAMAEALSITANQIKWSAKYGRP